MHIDIFNVSYKDNHKQILNNINITLTEKRIGIIGSNGSGKTTFAKLLNGLQVPSQGSVIVNGLNTKTAGKMIRRQVGFVFQNPDNQIVFPIVEEDVAFGMKNLKLSTAVIAEKTEQVLSRYGLLKLRNYPSHLLSGGEKQLLAISGVLVMNPKCIVFDEPTTLLDLSNKHKVMTAINELTQMVVVVSHDLNCISNFERVLVFEQGKVIVDDHPRAAIAAYKKLQLNLL